MMWTLVKRDSCTGMWRVICPVHGELARYRGFWPASRDAREHDESCGKSENAGPNPLRGAARTGV